MGIEHKKIAYESELTMLAQTGKAAVIHPAGIGKSCVAMQYHRAYGDLDVPVGYVDINGVRLGTWIYNMRKSYQGKQAACRIAEEQIAKLTKLGMVWESSYTVRLEKGFSEAIRYREAAADEGAGAAAGGYWDCLGQALWRQDNSGQGIDKCSGLTASENLLRMEATDRRNTE